ncbi:MAG: hypothetical protein ACFFA0_05730 [Promethearchaeota archaeon]
MSNGKDLRYIIPIFGAVLAVISIFTPAITIPGVGGQISVWIFGIKLDDNDLIDISGGFILGGTILMLFAYIGVALTIRGSLNLKKGEFEGAKLKLFLLIGGLLIIISSIFFMVQVITASSLEIYLDYIDFGFTVWGLLLAGAIIIVSIVLTL